MKRLARENTLAFCLSDSDEEKKFFIKDTMVYNTFTAAMNGTECFEKCKRLLE
jgi:hypothetical protein